MTATADPQAVVAAALGWIGTPYHDQASLRGVGCDCLGMIRGLWREIVGAEPTAVPPYTRDWGETGTTEIMVRGARSWLIEADVEHIVPGDVLLFRMRDYALAKHCGVLVAEDRFVHAYDRLGVVEEYLTEAWRRRLVYAFRFPAS